MKQLRNAEEVLEFYIYNVRMGTYDKKFMHNLQTSKVLMRQPITTNQVSLFKKVVKKYHKQLSYNNFDVNEIAELPWTLKVVESTSEFTQAHLSIVDDKLIVYTPYKAEFVKDFRSANLMVWDRNERKYICNYGLRTLKLAFDIICRHYSEINVCPNIQSILDELKLYENASYWIPTLVKSKTGRFYVAASNQALDNAMDTLDLKFECYNLSKMSELGIEITKEHVSDFEDAVNKKFLTCSMSHEINWDDTDFENLGKFLREINIDRIIAIKGYSTNTKNYADELFKINIPYKFFSGIKDTSKIAQAINSMKNKNVAILRFGKFGTAHNIGKKFVSKIVNIIDNSPVALQNETV